MTRHPVKIFLQQFRESFRQTGALVPSSRALARAITAHIGPSGAPRRILEAGAGTGVFTGEIAKRMSPFDRLDVYEINPAFADFLEERFRHEPDFRGLQERLSLFRASVLELPQDAVYDRIISGLPLNNFEPSMVRQLLDAFMSHLAPGGILSYFEYAFIRTMKRYVSPRSERERLRGISEITGEYVSRYQFSSDPVLLNIPPAVARHLVKPRSRSVLEPARRALRPAAAVQ